MTESNNEGDKKPFNTLNENEKTSSIQTYERPEIFIRHRRSNDWRDLKDHLHDVHKYHVIAYEIGSEVYKGSILIFPFRKALYSGRLFYF